MHGITGGAVAVKTVSPDRKPTGVGEVGGVVALNAGEEGHGNRVIFIKTNHFTIFTTYCT
jgi:hypothetical protein